MTHEVRAGEAAVLFPPIGRTAGRAARCASRRWLTVCGGVGNGAQG